MTDTPRPTPAELPRVLAWFSCGDASAAAYRIADAMLRAREAAR